MPADFLLGADPVTAAIEVLPYHNSGYLQSIQWGKIASHSEIILQFCKVQQI